MSDILDSTATSAKLQLGQTKRSNIDFYDDRDWFKVKLKAGNTYEFDNRGRPTRDGSLDDPALILYDRSGNIIATSDDNGLGVNSELFYTAAETRTFFVAARGFGGTTGTYKLSMHLFDQASGTTTDGKINRVGREVQATITPSDDEDWFGIHLRKGVVYAFDVVGRSEGIDPLIDVYGANGNLLVEAGTDFVFTPTSSGKFFLAVHDDQYADEGSYVLRTGYAVI